MDGIHTSREYIAISNISLSIICTKWQDSYKKQSGQTTKHLHGLENNSLHIRNNKYSERHCQVFGKYISKGDALVCSALVPSLCFHKSKESFNPRVKGNYQRLQIAT